jgi:hypothetical protein
MNTIWEWLERLDTAGVLRLLEAAKYFSPQQYNGAFERELADLLLRTTDATARQEISDLQGSDWAGYILNSLKKAGIRTDDQQEEDFQRTVIFLLANPGKLFTGWQPGKHGPLSRRFRASVWNSIRNILEKRRNRMKRFQNADPAAIAERTPERASGNSEIIDLFRRLVKDRLGDLALRVLDQRLSGGETKELVGIGTQSAFYVKQSVQSIKELAQRFAFRIGDSKFANMVATAMDREKTTVEKRKAAMAARTA